MTLVLVHGLGSAGTFWDNLRPALEPEHQVLAPDLPGHGPRARHLHGPEATPRALAEATIAQLRTQGVEDPHLVGLSLGGWVALEMAALGYGASVVALAPAGLWRAGAHIRREWEETIAHHLLAAFGPALAPFMRLPVAWHLALSANVVNRDRVSHQQFADAATALAQAKGYAACDRQAVRLRFEAGPRVRVPCAIAFGDRDHVLPPDSSQEQALAPTETAWVVVPDCGHAMSWDQPEACLELIGRTVGQAASAGA